MIARLNIVDRIMMPALLLASLYILVHSYLSSAERGWDLIDHPGMDQWALSVVGLAYVLYQAIRIGSPLLTFITGAVVLIGCFGPLVVNLKDYLRNYYWEPLEGGFAAIAAIAFMLAIVALPVVAVTCVAGIARYMRKDKISTFALNMLRASNKIEVGKLAQHFGISEMDARAILAESRRKGDIPFKAEIV
jgi:glucose-6-phosphate-specific signal transduction histidine kinase